MHEKSQASFCAIDSIGKYDPKFEIEFLTKNLQSITDQAIDLRDGRRGITEAAVHADAQ